MNKILFIGLAILATLIVFVGLVAGAYWVLLIPPVLLIGFWIVRK